jgi:hypothetical protein
LARHLPTLLDEGFVVEEGGQYRLCDDIENRLRIELGSSNSTESEEYYREQNVQARRAYHAGLRAGAPSARRRKTRRGTQKAFDE